MKRMMHLAAIAAIVGGCTVNVRGPEHALIPDGEQVVVTLAAGNQREGELIEVTDDRLILKENDRFVAVGLPEVRKVEIVRYALPVEKGWRDKLRLYSRYPQGLTPGQRRSLLEGAGQKGFPESPVPPENPPGT